ncbi:ABC transporter substrate-binding protein [Kineosporia sp. NBRC 101731]|uniref:ABC transporter substrate-binding protein n=1 Tax=Kineosporia sp. NBRC 101731 TaxID=3032199 RepID=UPI0024A58B3D|nr:ABC transporter substrate-binding protein [Kineosporia sp. NBRC 101731]GLY33836.1 ABC transporter substrate-binding protein [Kineosporia sp. NBRC 101731]
MSARTRVHQFALTATTLILLVGCGASSTTSSTRAADASGNYPLTVGNCGDEVTFTAAPERVLLLKSASVPYLSALGVLSDVTARAGAYPADYYDEATQKALDEIPLLTDKTDTSGHLQISQEVVISQEPDLVLGEAQNLTRDTLTSVGIPLLEEPGLCGDGLEDPGFDDVYDQMHFYGKVFNRQAEATAAVADLKKRLAAVEKGENRTAAVLYPTVGGGVTYAYGSRSMAQPQLEAAGFTNVFGDVDERVFEVTLEKLIGLNPDVLVLLYSDGDPDDVTRAVTDLPGSEKLTAVKNGDLMPQLFNFTEPPSPLAITGLERIEERFGRQ